MLNYQNMSHGNLDVVKHAFRYLPDYEVVRLDRKQLIDSLRALKTGNIEIVINKTDKRNIILQDINNQIIMKTAE